MKKVLSIAIVICLAVTMTCSSMAAAIPDESGISPATAYIQCPDCGYMEAYYITRTTVSSNPYQCPICNTGTITVTTTATYVDCPYCGVIPVKENIDIDITCDCQ